MKDGGTEHKHITIKIFGRVQGINFRSYAKKEAERLDIAGTARNQPDGSVLIEAEGEEENLDKFLKWCEKGPPLAQVQKVETENGLLVGYRGFERR